MRAALRATSLARGLAGLVAHSASRGPSAIGRWQVWKLAEPLRSYVIALPVVAIGAVGVAVPGTHWRATQATIFAALVGCAAIAIEATRTVNEPRGTVTRDLQSVWYLAIAIALPPFYALVAPIPLTAYKLWRVPRIVVYRRVFSNATLSLAYGCASLVFHALTPAIGGPSPGRGTHVLIWTGCVIACGVLAWLINHVPLVVAVRLADPATRLRSVLGGGEAVILDLVELSLAVSLSFLVTISPVLMTLALPSLVLHRRHLLHGQLVNQTRFDPKTGLLNATTWQREATAELDRAIRTRTPLAVAMVDIDHFKNVNDTFGHLAGDQALTDLARLFQADLREYDLIGRFGGEEFTILLPHTGHEEATLIAERLRERVARQLITIDDGTTEGFAFTVTISIGLATLNGPQRDLNDLVAAADNALYRAKKAGRNRVHALTSASEDPVLPPSAADAG